MTFLTLLVLIPLAQGVSAVAFFDSRIILHSKADPILRDQLGRTSQNSQEHFSVIVTFSEVPSTVDLDSLRSIGTLRTFTGHVATMTLSQESLQELATFDFVDRITAPKKLKPQLDPSVPDILANQVWTEVKDPFGNAVNGTGVIIGTIDTGIDTLHKDFYFSNGTSKILYIWDQSIDGNHPDGFDYGNECTPNDIQLHFCPEFDGNPWTNDYAGHGTAVAAIAASTGLASGRYIGVAPGAYIISVKLTDESEDHIIDGFNYLITKARQLGMPLVINISFGSSVGSHDGTEPLELALTDLADQGTPIVVPAGNGRNKSIHVDGTLGKGQSVTVTWSNEAASESYLDIWYSPLDTTAISVRTPKGDVVSGPTPDTGVKTSDGNVVISPDQRDTGKEWFIDITPLPGSALDSSAWAFTLTGVSISDGKWDAWTEPGKFTPTTDPRNVYIIDPFDTIDHPGTAQGVITVGSYETRYWWLGRCTPCIQFNAQKGYQGNWSVGRDFALGIGYLALSSGAGPTRDGRTKPELVAPGVNIVSALATNVPLVSQSHPFLDEPDNYHGVWRGSSFAAPQVTGVIALMLQMNRYLTPNEIKTLLIGGARQDQFTGKIDSTFGSPLWGWGKVNALVSTLTAPTLYSIRVQVLPTTEKLQANLTVDGHRTVEISLNQAESLVFEFRSNGTHTIGLPPFIPVNSETRYVVNGTPWVFSSGGIRVFQYRLQYLLWVNSQYGTVEGDGWYDANSTATVTVTPTSVSGHRFAGWSGSANSESPTAQIKMDSPKEVTAEWVTEVPTSPQISAEIILVLVAIIGVALSSVLRTRGPLRKPSLHQAPTP